MRQPLAVLWALMLSAGLAVAQFDRGQITGFVRDPSGASIINASVVVTNEASGLATTVTSNEVGYYQAPNLLPGSYTVAAEASGFKKFTVKGVNVAAAARVSVDVSLEVGAVTDSVEVVASTARVESESAQVARVIESRQIADLQLNGRNPIYLAQLKAGVTGGAIDTFAPDSLSTGGFNVNGSRSEDNLITFDGAVASRTRSQGSVLGTVNVDTVQEVQVLSANYNAEYGRSSGGQIRFVTKSGGKQFHGDLFEFFRNSALDANTWANNSSGQPSLSSGPNPFRFNQFGYDIGGPVYLPGKYNTDRNKLFFFVSQEWIRWRRASTSNGVVPSLAMRQGDFSELLNPRNTFFNAPRTITDATSKLPFPNNIIPPSRLSPNGAALLGIYPSPTPGFQQGSNNWVDQEANPRNSRKDTVRADYVISSKHNLSFRGSNFYWTSVDPFRGTFPFASLDWSRPNHSGIVSLTSTLSPTLINEASFSAGVDRVFLGIYDRASYPYHRGSYRVNYPYLFPVGKDIPDRIPTVVISGFSTIDGGYYPSFSSGPIYTWSDNMTKIVGNHMVKFGVSIERSGQNDRDQILGALQPASANNQNGQFGFLDVGDPRSTGLAVANAALGYFNSYGELGPRTYTIWRATALDAFLQDGWKVTPKMKLEYGVRYEYWPPYHAQWNNIAEFLPSFYDRSKAAVVDPSGGFIVSGDRYNGVVLPGNGWPSGAKGRVDPASNPDFDRLFHNLPGGFSQTHDAVFAPRLGIAYSLDDKTAIRTGFGMFHNKYWYCEVFLGANPPIQPRVGVTNGNVDSPGGGTQRDFPLIMTSRDPVLYHPTALNWNFTLERELPGSLTLQTAYVGRRGYHETRGRNINQLQPGTVQANPGTNQDALRPYPGIGIATLAENAGSSQYHALQVQVQRRFNSGLGFGIAYTFSKAIDNASGSGTLLFNAYDDRGFRALADFDRPHVFIANYIYELPFYRGRTTGLGRAFGGWELSGITQFQSGGPLSVWRGEDIAGVGPGSGSQPWNVNGDPILPGDQRGFSLSNSDANFWFNRSVFSRPAQGTFGNAGRNIIRGPGLRNSDIGLRKNLPVSEKVRLQFRAEFFNFLNHPNWNNPTTDPTSGSFGKVQSKSTERNLQLALKIIF